MSGADDRAPAPAPSGRDEDSFTAAAIPLDAPAQRPDLTVDPALLRWYAAERDALGADVLDAHTHVGEHDPDTMRCSPRELIDHLEQAGARGVVFPLREPGGYAEPNAAVIAAAEASGGRLVAFGRVDPARAPLQEARRALDAGARGLKLHPRGERFALDDPRLDDVWALAHERRLPVLVHAGRGIPSLGAHAVQLATRYPGVRLILAHAGISDLAWIGRQARELPNLFFDTSWWAPADLMALFATVPAGQILFASDAPYGRTPIAALQVIRIARQVGVDDAHLRSVLGAQLQRLLDGAEPLDGSAPLGTTRIAVDALLDRVAGYLTAAFGTIAARSGGAEMLHLARLACAVPADAPQAAHCRAILDLLGAPGRRVAAAGAGGRAGLLPGGMDLLVLALTIARTPDVPVLAPLELAEATGPDGAAPGSARSRAASARRPASAVSSARPPAATQTRNARWPPADSATRPPSAKPTATPTPIDDDSHANPSVSALRGTSTSQSAKPAISSGEIVTPETTSAAAIGPIAPASASGIVPSHIAATATSSRRSGGSVQRRAP